jgi:hypothetical protein
MTATATTARELMRGKTTLRGKRAEGHTDGSAAIRIWDDALSREDFVLSRRSGFRDTEASALLTTFTSGGRFGEFVSRTSSDSFIDIVIFFPLS